ncbi:hypothetical protein DUNSADRAFT_11224 [Dunaliella salina]|uniref:Uncharacterized protein n=1 Tax=Dunaliella salina TaxID=3046 RepID=A0ABQ7GDX1_DUNSA|nr:hypothetical protein DUNSADRAFT_11224 [Dunaliella salina]|eukprot:KAF5832789.1 hypothetical protein DUNSADRAFT_11224 [Dunaliella salina]
MYHKMEAALSAAVMNAEAADDAASGSRSSTAGHTHHTSSRHPRRSAASISAAHYAATATRGGIAAASPAFKDVDVSVHGSTAAAAREPVSSRMQYTSSMRLPRHLPHAHHTHAAPQPPHKEHSLLSHQPSSPLPQSHRATLPGVHSGRRREGGERHTHNGVHSPLVSVVAPAIAGEDPPHMPGAAMPHAHNDLPTIPCSEGQPSPNEPSRQGSSELLQDFEGRTMSGVGANGGLQRPLASATCAHADQQQGSEGFSRGELDLSMRGGIMGTGDASLLDGASGGGRAVGGALAALQAAAAAEHSNGGAAGGAIDQLESIAPSLSRPISLNLGRHQQQQQLEQQQLQRQRQQQQQQQQALQHPISCAAGGEGHWKQQQQQQQLPSFPLRVPSGEQGNGPMLSSTSTGMGSHFPWVSDTRSTESDKAGGSSALVNAPTPLLGGASPGAGGPDTNWAPSSCGSHFGLSSSNLLLAMPPLPQHQQEQQQQQQLLLHDSEGWRLPQLEQQQHDGEGGRLPPQGHHVVHVGPEQMEGCDEMGGIVRDAGAHFCRTSAKSSASADPGEERPSRQKPKTAQQRQHDAQLTFLKEQMEQMMQSKGDSSVSALVDGAFLPNLEEELEALEEEAGGFATQGRHGSTQQQDLGDMASLAAADEQQGEVEGEGAEGWEGEQEGTGQEGAYGLPVSLVCQERGLQRPETEGGVGHDENLLAWGEGSGGAREAPVQEECKNGVPHFPSHIVHHEIKGDVDR